MVLNQLENKNFRKFKNQITNYMYTFEKCSKRTSKFKFNLKPLDLNIAVNYLQHYFKIHSKQNILNKKSNECLCHKNVFGLPGHLTG